MKSMKARIRISPYTAPTFGHKPKWLWEAEVSSVDDPDLGLTLLGHRLYLDGVLGHGMTKDEAAENLKEQLQIKLQRIEEQKQATREFNAKVELREIDL